MRDKDLRRKNKVDTEGVRGNETQMLGQEKQEMH